MRGLDDLVTSGKVRYVAFSDVPAWYAARAQTLAEWRGFEPLCALQLEYSLIERGIEYEFPSLCRELGIGLMTWGPLANGLLSGKYVEVAETGGDADYPDGRIKLTATHAAPETDKRNDRTWAIVRTLAEIADELGVSSARVAISWVMNRPAVATVLLGARSVEQITETLAAATLEIPEEMRTRLDEATAPARAVPYGFLPWLQRRINVDVSAAR
jgi:aryl-alcohol dehydrogenase-like predicted oxidoreductase